VISGDLKEQLKFVQRIDDVKTEAKTTVQLPPDFQDFPDFGRVRGTLAGKYRIEIDPSAKDVIHPVRRQTEDRRKA
jgi:hypothetical protein